MSFGALFTGAFLRSIYLAVEMGPSVPRNRAKKYAIKKTVFTYDATQLSRDISRYQPLMAKRSRFRPFSLLWNAAHGV